LDFRSLLSPDFLNLTAYAVEIRGQRRTLALLQFQTSSSLLRQRVKTKTKQKQRPNPDKFHQQAEEQTSNRKLGEAKSTAVAHPGRTRDCTTAVPLKSTIAPIARQSITLHRQAIEVHFYPSFVRFPPISRIEVHFYPSFARFPPISRIEVHFYPSFARFPPIGRIEVHFYPSFARSPPIGWIEVHFYPSFPRFHQMAGLRSLLPSDAGLLNVACKPLNS